MATFRQNSFAGGMLSPSLEGRTDNPKRLAGARRIHNFFVTPFGTLRRRPGIRFVDTLYGNDGLLEIALPDSGDRKVRMIDFRGSDNVDVLLVLSHMKGIALRNGSTTGAEPFDTPWQGQHLEPRPFDGTQPGIKWSQSGNRLLVTHPEYQPRYLVAPETDADSWTVVLGDTLVDAPELAHFDANYVAAGA